jgi:hypothetical protein
MSNSLVGVQPQHNPIIPPQVQHGALWAILAEAEAVAAGGKTPVVFIDLDLTALLPTIRTAKSLAGVGERFGVPHLKAPGELRDRNNQPILPGYTEEAWMNFIIETGMTTLYPHINWDSPDRNKPDGHLGGELYASFRAAYWQQDLRTDDVSPGLLAFMSLVTARRGRVAFLSGRPGAPEDSLFTLEQGGIRDPILYFGQQQSGLPVPREHVRDRDADTKFVRTKEAEARGEVVVAVVDDRASNRSAVLSAAPTSKVLSVAVAAPGFSCTPDATDPCNPLRISTFSLDV